MSDVAEHDDDNQSERFLSVKTAARMLHMSPMTLYRSISAGEFPAVRVRRRISVPAKAIDEMEAAAIKTGSVVNAADWTDTNR